MYQFYLEIDLHKQRTYVVWVDQAGQMVDERLSWLPFSSALISQRKYTVNRT